MSCMKQIMLTLVRAPGEYTDQLVLLIGTMNRIFLSWSGLSHFVILSTCLLFVSRECYRMSLL